MARKRYGALALYRRDRWGAAERLAGQRAATAGTHDDPLSTALLSIVEEEETWADFEATAADVGHTSIVYAGVRYHKVGARWLAHNGAELINPDRPRRPITDR